MTTRRTLLTAAVATMALWAAGCGGAASTLRTKGAPTGKGPSHLVVQNNADVPVFELYVAKTDAVDASVRAGAQPGSDQDIELWGEDYLGRSRIRPGDTFTVGELAPDRYDVLAVDPDGREQLVKGLMLKAGGRYVLELGSRWQQAR